MTQPLYLDYAAATPLDPRVLEAMAPYLSDRFYNPSALYLASKAVANDIADARARIATWLGARPAEIIFTAGGTEANNLAIHGIMRRYPEANLVVSAVEHEAVLEPARQYACQLAPVKADGRLDLAELESMINDQTVLISVMYANNEIGTIEPIREVAELVRQKRAERQKLTSASRPLPLYLHTDACQAANYLDLHAARLGVDLMTLNAGKIYGPKQSGALYVKSGIELQPQLLGGGQERGLRSGTENVASIMGFAAALDIAQIGRQAEGQRLAALRKDFLGRLQTTIPSTVINGSLSHRLPNNVHVTFPGRDNERLLMQLDEQGIMCAAGSACTASNDEPSHVLKALGLSDADAQASLRFTMGRQTSDDDIKTVITTLQKLLS